MKPIEQRTKTPWESWLEEEDRRFAAENQAVEYRMAAKEINEKAGQNIVSNVSIMEQNLDDYTKHMIKLRCGLYSEDT